MFYSINNGGLQRTVPSVGRLADSPHNKDLEIPPYRLHPNFAYGKTSLNPDVSCNYFQGLKIGIG